MPLTDLYEVRTGKETTWGTAVAQTAKRHGITDISIKSLIENRLLQDIRGDLYPGHVSVQLKDGAEASVGGWLSYEDAPYLFDGIEIATPAGVGPYTYDYVGASSAASSPRFETFAYGDGTDIFAVNGMLMRSFQIQGASGEPVTWQAEYFGKSVSTDLFDSDAEADRAVNPVMGDHIALYIDPSTDAVGTTQISSVAFAFTLSYNTNREVRQHLGSLQPSGWVDRKHEGTLELMVELSDTTSPFIDSMLGQAGTPFQRVVRIAATSDSLICRFDFNGVTDELPTLLEDRDGVQTYTMTLRGQYHSTLGNWFAAHVQNEVSALP